ncbi:hypothetical protein D9M69_417890 [compost metagenome]
MGAQGDVLHDAVHLLRRVGHTDGEDQERHQDRIGVQGIAQPGDDAQLPDHRQQRADDHQQTAAQAAGVGQDDEEGGDHGQAEEGHDAHQAVDQVTHQLGEADDAELDRALPFFARCLGLGIAGVFEAQAELVFQGAGELVVVHALAASGGLVQQRNHQHGGLEVVGHQAADDTGTGDVLPQLLDAGRRAVVAVGHHRAALEAFLGHFGPAHAGRPEGLHPGTVDAGGEEQFVVNLLEGVEVGRVENVALGILHHHAHAVAQAAQGLAVLQEVLDVGMTLGNHLLEAGLELQAGNGHVAQQQGHQEDAGHERQPVVEHQALEQVAALRIEVFQIPDYRHRALFNAAHDRVASLLFLFSASQGALGNAPRAYQQQAVFA